MPLLIRGPTSQAAPSEYTLAPREAFIPESVTATFNGTGAAGAFLPTLSIYAQSGELLARSPATEVAAGSSAEVTFAPLLRAAQVAAAGGGGYPFAASGINGFYNVASGVATQFGIDVGSLITTDGAIFFEQAHTTPGLTGLGIGATGTYAAFWTAQYEDTAGAPVAAPETFVAEAQDSGGGMVTILPILFSTFARGYQSLGVRNFWDVGWLSVFAIHGATPAGNPIILTGNQSTGSTLRVFTSLTVFQLSTSTFGF
jgi:hypothetical protein